MNDHPEASAGETQACKTPLADLRRAALSHYETAATHAHCWMSDVPRAINFYYDEMERRESPAPSAPDENRIAGESRFPDDGVSDPIEALRQANDYIAELKNEIDHTALELTALRRAPSAPVGPITDAMAIAAMREQMGQMGESFEAMRYQMRDDEWRDLLAEWRAILACALAARPVASAGGLDEPTMTADDAAEFAELAADERNDDQAQHQRILATYRALAAMRRENDDLHGFQLSMRLALTDDIGSDDDLIQLAKSLARPVSAPVGPSVEQDTRSR